jgi:ammonia channel protein AmtB
MPISQIRTAFSNHVAQALELVSQLVGPGAASSAGALKGFIAGILVAIHPAASEEIRAAWKSALGGLADKEELAVALSALSPKIADSIRKM